MNNTYQGWVIDVTSPPSGRGLLLDDGEVMHQGMVA
jgi:hypothetical protein